MQPLAYKLTPASTPANHLGLRKVNNTTPEFGMLPLLLPSAERQAVNAAAKGVIPRLSNGILNSSQRLADTLILLTAGIVPVVGHLLLWPLALGAGALAIKDFARGARIGTKMGETLVKRFPQITNALKKIEIPFNKGSEGGYRWVKKGLPAIYASIGLFLAGMVIPPLHLIGGLSLLVHPIAYSGGFLKNFAIAASKLFSKGA